jgi:hypothetical protein
MVHVKINLVIIMVISLTVTILIPDRVLGLQGSFANQPLTKKTINSTDNMTRNNLAPTTGLRKSNTIDSRIEPSDLFDQNTSNGHLTNPQLVEKELTNLSEDQIKEYPLRNVPIDELVIVLNNLSVQDLEKTLLNIPAEDLQEIFGKLSDDKLQSILNKVPIETRSDILNRITGQLFK